MPRRRDVQRRANEITNKPSSEISSQAQTSSPRTQSSPSSALSKEKPSSVQLFSSRKTSQRTSSTRTESGKLLNSAHSSETVIPKVPKNQDLKLPTLDVGAAYRVALSDNTSPNNFTVQVDQEDTIDNLTLINQKLKAMTESYSGNCKNVNIVSVWVLYRCVLKLFQTRFKIQ